MMVIIIFIIRLSNVFTFCLFSFLQVALADSLLSLDIP